MSGCATGSGICDDSSVIRVDGEINRLDGLASGDDPAGGNSDVGSDVCVVQDPIPTAVSVRPSVSRMSAVARTFGPAVSEEYAPVVFAEGGGGRLLMHTPWL